MELTVENVEKIIAGMSVDQRQDLIKKVAPVLSKVWLPQPGPQSEAMRSEADELLYGGAAGGGKTDLLLGLAATQHQKSLLFRRQSTDLDGLWDRLAEIVGPSKASNDGVKKRMRLMDGRTIEGGHLEKPGSEKSWQGRPHDLIGFDEGAQLDENKVAFVIQWLRSTVAGQRQRMVIATNPPIPETDKDGALVDTGSGDWLLRWFAPWLDDKFPNPAKEGELRWCYMKRDGDRLTTIWVEGPGYYVPDTGERIDNPPQVDVDTGKVSKARSRTFIRSLVHNNVYLKGTGYAERLSSTPEPLRSMLLLGDFTVKGEDHPMQVIPTLWVLQAQERWNEREHEVRLRKPKQLVLAGDIAQGGADTTVLAPLLETDFFEELLTQPGRLTPTGREVVRMIMDTRADKSMIVLDATGGWAGATAERLEDAHDIVAELCVASKDAADWTPDMTYKYANVRAAMWWIFRLALDPKSGFNIALPPSTRLRAQLTTPHWQPKGKLLYIESKDEIRRRLQGASTDEADAVIMAWYYRDRALALRHQNDGDKLERLIHGKTREEQRKEAQQAMELEDPLKDW